MNYSQSEPTLRAVGKKKRKANQSKRVSDRDWDNSVSVSDTIPEYDALLDPFCEISGVLSKEFKRMQQEKQSLSRSFKKKLRDARKLQVQQDLDETSLFSLASPTSSSLSSNELNKEVLEAQKQITELILEREGALEQVHKLVQAQAHISSLLEVLTRLRRLSLEIVHRIHQWRTLCQKNDRVFFYQGKNYLLKLLSDLDFLAETKSVLHGLGVERETLLSNPFMSPYSLLPPSTHKRMLKTNAEDEHESHKGNTQQPPPPTEEKVEPSIDEKREEASEEKEDKPETKDESKEESTSSSATPASPTTHRIGGDEEIQEEAIVQAEQILIKEMRNSDLRAINAIRVKEQEASSPLSPNAKDLDEELERWRNETKCEFSRIAQSWGLPKSFPEVQQALKGEAEASDTLPVAGKLGKVKRTKTKNQLRVSLSTDKLDIAYRPLTSMSQSRRSISSSSATMKRKRPGTSAAGKSRLVLLTPLDHVVEIPEPRYSFCSCPEATAASDDKQEESQDWKRYTLSASAIFELASTKGMPSTDVLLVLVPTLILLSPGKSVPSALRWEVLREPLLSTQGLAFLYALRDFRARNIPSTKLQVLAQFVADPRFNPQQLSKTNETLAALCAWVVNSCSSKPKYVATLGKLLGRETQTFRVVKQHHQSPKNTEEKQVGTTKEPMPSSAIAPESAQMPQKKEKKATVRELEDSQVEVGPMICSYKLDQPNGVFILTFLLANKPLGALILKCYNPTTSEETRMIIPQVPVNLQRLDEAKLYCRTLKTRIKVVMNPQLCVQIHGLQEPNLRRKWAKVAGTTRLFGSAKYSISAFVSNLEHLEVSDFLFKAKDARFLDAPSIVKKLSSHDAAAVLHYAKHLFHGQDAEKLVEGLIDNMRFHRGSDGSAEINFIRHRPLHNPAGLSNPEDPRKDLNLHDEDLSVEDLMKEVAGIPRKPVKKVRPEDFKPPTRSNRSPPPRSAESEVKPAKSKVIVKTKPKLKPLEKSQTPAANASTTSKDGSAKKNKTNSLSLKPAMPAVKKRKGSASSVDNPSSSSKTTPVSPTKKPKGSLAKKMEQRLATSAPSEPQADNSKVSSKNNNVKSASQSASETRKQTKVVEDQDDYDLDNDFEEEETYGDDFSDDEEDKEEKKVSSPGQSRSVPAKPPATASGSGPRPVSQANAFPTKSSEVEKSLPPSFVPSEEEVSDMEYEEEDFEQEVSSPIPQEDVDEIQDEVADDVKASARSSGKDDQIESDSEPEYDDDDFE